MVAAAPSSSERLGGRKVPLIAAAVALAGLGAVIVINATSSDATSSSAPSRTATIEPAAVASTINPTEPPTTAPAAVVVVTTAVEVVLTAAPPTIPPTTLPPATTAPAIDPLEADAAAAFFTEFLSVAAQRDYASAWSMLTPRYQEKYLGYDNFVRFWETVDGAGVREWQSIGTVPAGQTVRMWLWFGRRADGTVSNEIVEVDITQDSVTAVVLIDDYRYQGVG